MNIFYRLFKMKSIQAIPFYIVKTILYIFSCVIFTLLCTEFYRTHFLITQDEINKFGFYTLIGYIMLDMVLFVIVFILVNKLVKVLWLIVGVNISLNKLDKEYFGAVALVLVCIIVHFFDSFQYKMSFLKKKLEAKEKDS